ncbi:MAG: DUF4835 family protein [Bacteroidota bacterium]|nr:DUF4835 family protein [Bacteroidota bacterium]
MKYCFIIIVFFLLLFSHLTAQEIECEVKLNLESLTSSGGRDNLSDFTQQIKQYINSYRWTTEDYGDEKIKCTMDISIQGTKGEHQYVAQVFIGSQRPIYKAERNSAIVRLMDDKWEFEYIRNQTLTHIDSRFSPLLSFIDFYMYLILGYDADTYTSNGGTPYFQKAYDIVNSARGSATDTKGWDLAPQGTYSRAQLIDELLNPKFQDFRKAVHIYYYRGIDSLFTKKTRPLKRMLQALDKIGKLRQKINQPSLVIRTFFDTKYLEIAESFQKYTDPAIYNRLSEFDPEHKKTYDEYFEKRK